MHRCSAFLAIAVLVATPASAYTELTGMAVGPDGSVFFENAPSEFTRNLNRFDRDTGAVSGLAFAISQGGEIEEGFSPIAVAPNGDLLLGGRRLESTGAHLLITLDPVTLSQHSATLALGVLRDVAVEATGDVISAVLDTVFRIDPTTGSHSVVSTSGALTQAGWVAVGSGGDLFVAGFGADGQATTTDDQLVRVDPVAGTQSLLATGLPAGQLSFDANGDLLLVPDACRVSSTCLLHWIDPADGSVKATLSISAHRLLDATAAPNGDLLGISLLGVWEIDRSSGALTFLVPEPATALLIACGLLFFSRRIVRAS